MRTTFFKNLSQQFIAKVNNPKDYANHILQEFVEAIHSKGEYHGPRSRKNPTDFAAEINGRASATLS